jgi:hypothetical protein
VTEIYIISGISWTVPADWNSSNNTMKTIGGGGSGSTAAGNNDGGGGGGGYSKLVNLSLTAGGSATFQVGVGGAASTSGTDTWFNGASFGASSVGAKGGSSTGSFTGGVGGSSGSGIGTTVFSGGAGGTSTNINNGAGGGGGAAGPNGNGQAGGASALNPGAGGGGAGGGSSTAGSDGSGNNGGAGGTAQDGTAGGAGGVSGVSAPTAGSHGSGGGGGANIDFTREPGANGGNGIEFDATHGAGGGGGGSGGHSAVDNPITGGAGGLYGGGGGGGAFNGGTGGAGGDGLIVITYTPAISATILAESRNAMEHQTLGCIDAFNAIEFGRSVPSNVGAPTEGRREIRRDGETPIEVSCAALRSSRIPLQWAGSLVFYTDAFMPFEAAALLRRDTLGLVEFASVTLRNAQSRFELLTILRSEALLVAESLTSGARILVDRPLCLEWADPPSLLILAPERLLRSPGRVRVLAAPGSIHPLRDH